MADNGIELTQKEQLGKLFRSKSQSKVDYSMKGEYTTNLDRKKIDIFEKMYNYYNKNRHPYMHAGDIDAKTAVVGNYDKAVDLLNDLIISMKTQYSGYCSI